MPRPQPPSSRGKKEEPKDDKKLAKELIKESNFGEDDRNSLSYHLKKMDEKSHEQMQNELREVYMQLKDLGSRCMIDMDHISKNDNRVFYFKPNTVFLDEPEKQKKFRNQFF